MNRFGFAVYCIVSVILTVGYCALMNIMLNAIFEGDTITMTFKVFAVLMFPSTFALFMLMVFLTYHFIARAMNMYVDLKWALYVIAVQWVVVAIYMATKLF